MADEARIDKYLWTIRAFKTRTEAADACSGGKVKLNGASCKPSRAVKAGDMLEVRKGVVLFKYRVKDFPPSRVGAALVPQYAEDLTEESERAKMHAPVETFFVRRERGTGRPTKKDRRTLDALWEEFENNNNQ